MTSSCLVIAFPQLNETDLQFIESVRAWHDEQFDLVKPHFTFVFPVPDITVNDFYDEVIKQADSAVIEFVIRSAVAIKDDLTGKYCVFLVPVEGASEIIHLHKKLHSGILNPYYHREIEFIPHITIAQKSSEAAAVTLANSIHAEMHAIHGRIDALTVVQFDGASVTSLFQISLK